MSVNSSAKRYTLRPVVGVGDDEVVPLTSCLMVLGLRGGMLRWGAKETTRLMMDEIRGLEAQKL